MKRLTILAAALALAGCGTFTTPETPRPGPFGHMSPYKAAMQQPNCRTVVNSTVADGATTVAAIAGEHGYEANPTGLGGIVAGNVALALMLPNINDPELQNYVCHRAAAVKVGVVTNNLAVIGGASNAGGIGILATILWWLFAEQPANLGNNYKEQAK